MRHVFRLMIILPVFVMIFLPDISISAKSQKTALVIGNGAYNSSPLRNPVNDASDIASALKKLGFKVILKTDANQRTMKKFIRTFGKELRNGGVGLFYYAGHAVQVHGINYLIPIGAQIESESDIEYETIDAGRVLGKMEDAGNGLNIIILDACRDNPFARSFRTSEKGLARMDAPTGSILAYATAPGSIAADGAGRNGLYTSKLLKHMTTPGLEIGRVFRKVRIDVVRSSQKKQVPWESSSLIGEFYFNPKRGIAVVKSTQKIDTGLKAEQERLEKERKELSLIEAEIEERKTVEAERKRIEAKKEKLLAMSNGSARKTKRDERFIAYDNGTVKDTKTGFMWASKDNWKDINWWDAKKYCENYRGGGYTDWRMPTQNELAGLYDKSESYRATQSSWNVYLTKLIELSTGIPWASETRGTLATYFHFSDGSSRRNSPAHAVFSRALPVRSGKRGVAPSSSYTSYNSAREIKRDERFVAYTNWTVKDTKTGLMWASLDNGEDINWWDAKKYCENYRVGGYADWRMPTQNELAGLYDKSESYRVTQSSYNVYLTKLIELSTSCPWASETRGSKAAVFNFYAGYRSWGDKSLSYYLRALPVRRGK